MKKSFSLILSLALLMTTLSALTVQAADASSYFKEDETFFFSFENESDFDYADMKFDNVSNGSFQTSGVSTYYTPGANGSAGAVAAHVEVKEGNQGISNDAISGVRLMPGTEYELTMDVKLLSAANYAVRPNINVFVMTEGATTYSNAACTEGESTSGSYYVNFAVKGDSIFELNGDGTVSDDWGTMSTTFTVPTALSGGRFLKPDELASFKIFFRFGSSPHSIDTDADFTPEFQASREEITVRPNEIRKNYWTEYAIDNVCLRPAANTNEPEPEPREMAFWDNDFEQANWTNSGDGTTYGSQKTSAVTTVNDTPEALPDSTQALKLTYAGADNNGGFLDLRVTVSDNSKKLWYNRTYKIDFWAKGSEAVAKYSEEHPDTMCIIQERASESRLERRKDKWAQENLRIPFSDEWQHYTIYYRETLDESLSRSSETNGWNTLFDFRFNPMPATGEAKTENINGEDITYYFSYENDQGEMVYCQEFSDFEIYIDDFKVEPLDVVYNGDMSIASETDSTYYFSHYDGRKGSSGGDFYTTGADTFTPSALGGGTITADDGSFAEASGLEDKNILKLTDSDDKMHQEVEVDNKKTYTISFWAKADDEAAAGKMLLPVFDRSITGETRDDQQVTITVKNGGGEKTINVPGSEDYLGVGYGQLTGETGDVPFMLFSGSFNNSPFGNNHESDKLNLTGPDEKIVKDDYFGRMKSVNGYEDQEAPTAWNYDYYNGSEWVSTNDLTSAASSMELSQTWTKYEFKYECSYEGDHYRMPEFSIDTSEAANFSLADISIVEEEEDVVVPPTDDDPEFKASNVVATSDKTSLTTTDYIDVTWDFEMVSGKETTEAPGKSIIKIYATDSGSRAFIAAARADEAGKARIKASNDLFGKTLEFEVIPAGENGAYGHSAFGTFDGKVVMALDTTLTMGVDQASVDWSVSINSADAEGAYTAYVAQYDANNKLVSVSSAPVAFTTGENTDNGNVAVSQNTVTAKLLLWDENMKPVSDVQTVPFMPVNTDPFAGDNDVNVVFLGGSITQGAGASNAAETCYAALTGKWFESTYEKDGRNVTWHNVGVGGTPSQYGLLRLNRDVISKNPDVVFVEFAVNDGGSDTRRYMEGIVRSLQSLDHVPYIIFLYTTNETYTTPTAYHEEVAEYYGIPQISLKDALKRELNGENARERGYLGDSVHPTDLGYAVYFDEIKTCLETNRFFQKPIEQSEKLVPESTGVNTIFTPSSEADLSGGTWTTGGSGNRQYVMSSTPGDSFELEFEGNVLAIEHGLNRASAKYEIYVDDERIGSGDPYYDQDKNQLVLGYANFNLSDKGTHTLRIEVTDQKNAASTGNQVMIYNIITGTTLDY